MGLINAGYILDLMGGHKRLEIRDWEERRLHQTIDFPVEPDVWYTMQMRVEVVSGKAHIRGKVWKTGTPEPEVWTIEVDDMLPIREGSPGLYGYSAADIFYDNIKVMVNPK